MMSVIALAYAESIAGYPGVIGRATVLPAASPSPMIAKGPFDPYRALVANTDLRDGTPEFDVAIAATFCGSKV